MAAITPTSTPTAALLTVDSLILQSNAQGGQVAIDGSGTPGIQAQLMANARVVSTTTVNSSGLWSIVAQLSEPDQYAIGLQAVLTDSAVVAIAAPMNALAVRLPAPTDTPLALPTATTVQPPLVNQFAFEREADANVVKVTGSGDPG
ncbi:MAG: hypothetical protein KDE47_13085, partial [Caldilineaceae bacterium]|nr:hypothetical protein [Caldilineaceae bacterium]